MAKFIMRRGFTESNFHPKCVIVKTPPGRENVILKGDSVNFNDSK